MLAGVTTVIDVERGKGFNREIRATSADRIGLDIVDSIDGADDGG